MECFQPTSSFKIRGIGRLYQELIAQGCHQLVSYSGGNAAPYAGIHTYITHKL